MGPLKTMAVAASLALVAGTVSLPTIASADELAFGLYDGGDDWGVIDLNASGSGAASVHKLADALVGLGELGGNPNDIFGLSATGNLYSVSLSGVETPDGSTSGITFIDFGSTATSLFGIGVQGGKTFLYDLNTNGTIASQVAFNGGAVISRNNGMSMSTGSSTLYFTDMISSTEEDLYTVNTSSGALTLLGTLSTGGAGLQVGGLASFDGSLWAAANNGGGPHGDKVSIFTVNASGPTDSKFSDLTPSGHGPIFGLAFAGSTTPPPVPEPGEWALMLAGFGAVGGMMRLRRRREVVA